MLTEVGIGDLLPDKLGDDIVCPTLIVACKEDQGMPYERSIQLATHIKNSELVTMEKCGHMAMLEQPERMNQVLNAWV